MASVKRERGIYEERPCSFEVEEFMLTAQLALSTYSSLKSDMQSHTEALQQCVQASQSLNETLELARQQSEYQLSQTALEQSALNELYELYRSLQAQATPAAPTSTSEAQAEGEESKLPASVACAPGGSVGRGEESRLPPRRQPPTPFYPHQAASIPQQTAATLPQQLPTHPQPPQLLQQGRLATVAALPPREGLQSGRAGPPQRVKQGMIEPQGALAHFVHVAALPTAAAALPEARAGVATSGVADALAATQPILVPSIAPITPGLPIPTSLPGSASSVAHAPNALALAGVLQGLLVLQDGRVSSPAQPPNPLHTTSLPMPSSDAAAKPPAGTGQLPHVTQLGAPPSSAASHSAHQPAEPSADPGAGGLAAGQGVERPAALLRQGVVTIAGVESPPARPVGPAALLPQLLPQLLPLAPASLVQPPLMPPPPPLVQPTMPQGVLPQGVLPPGATPP